MSNIQPYIIINGVNSRTISGLLITSLPPISKPQVRTQVETVDGRDGDIVTPLGFAAYDKPIKIGLTHNYNIDDIIEFFNTSGMVIFSNEPTKYYRFAIYEQIDFEKLIRFKTAEVVLHVQPYKFSTTEEPLLFNDPTEISVENNGNTDARPNLLITGSGEIDVSLNGSQLLSMNLGEDDQTVIIDSENMNAYGAQSAIREVVADIEPKQAGSGDPSPDNIREISGYSELNLTRCGKNLYQSGNVTEQFDAGVGFWTLGGTLGSNVPDGSLVLNAGTYTLSNFPTREIRRYDETGARVDTAFGTMTFTLAKREKVKFSIVTNSQAYNVQIEVGGTATTYEAYNGNTYTVNFGQTVYGGKLNVTTGLLEVNKIIKVGFTRGNIDSSGKLYSLGAPANILTWESSQTSAPGLLTNCFETVGLEVARRLNSGQVAQLGKTLWISGYVGKEDELDAILPNLQIVYSIAEPYTVQLTPTQINNLLGLNNLSSDTGDLSVKYKSGGVIQTQTGDIVTFTVGVGDMDKGTLLNRLITGNYDKIRLKKGENVISFTGNVKQVSIDKYSRWI